MVDIDETTTGVRCTNTELELLRPLAELSKDTFAVIAAWLATHDIEPTTIEVGAVVERDPDDEMLRWREYGLDGDRVRRWRYAGRDVWPAPFPAFLRCCGGMPATGTTSHVAVD